MSLNERGQKEQSSQRMTTSGREPAAEAAEARVLPGTRDPLGMMQYLRTVDWSATREVTSPVYDGHKLYEVRAKLASGSVAVGVPAGDYRATKIALHVFENGVESKDAYFALYLANEDRKSTRLNSSHQIISYAVFCLKKKKKIHILYVIL